MANSYELGTTVRCTGTFTVGGAATDPTTVTFKTQNPAGTVTSYTYAGSTVTKTGTGVYRVDVSADVPGTWVYRFVGTGTAAAAANETFTVDSEF